MKRFVTILLIVLTMLTSVGMADAYYILCNPSDYINARISPSKKSDSVGMLYCGTEIESDGEIRKDKAGNKWLHIINAPFEVDDAWVCLTYAQETPITIEKLTAIVVSNGRTAIRKSPGGKRTKWVNNGDELKVLAYSSDWVLTTKGYVAYECLEFIGE